MKTRWPGLGLLSLESLEGQGKTMLRASWLVKTQQALLPERGAAAAHAAP